MTTWRLSPMDLTRDPLDANSLPGGWTEAGSVAPPTLTAKPQQQISAQVSEPFGSIASGLACSQLTSSLLVTELPHPKITRVHTTARASPCPLQKRPAAVRAHHDGP